MSKFALMLSFAAVLALAVVISPASAATITLRPDGQGANSAWTNNGCGSGLSEWQCVDEDPANTSDFLSTTGTGRESFTFQNTGLVGNPINSVTIHFFAQRVAAADACFGAMTRSGGVNYQSGVQKCTTANYSNYSHTYTTNPATGAAWTVAAVDALEAGMYGLNPNGGGRVAQVFVVVDYNASVCGNNIYETGETCDGTALNSQTCTTQGFASGTLLCNSACNGYDTSACVASVCGNNIVETGETCDGTALNGQTCSSQGFSGGSLACNVSCTGYNSTACYTNTCSDSDGGLFSSTAGTASGNFLGAPYASSDVCIGFNLLSEYFCSGSVAVSTNITCNGTNGSNGTCFAGACI